MEFGLGHWTFPIRLFVAHWHNGDGMHIRFLSPIGFVHEDVAGMRGLTNVDLIALVHDACGCRASHRDLFDNRRPAGFARRVGLCFCWCSGMGSRAKIPRVSIGFSGCVFEGNVLHFGIWGRLEEAERMEENASFAPTHGGLNLCRVRFAPSFSF